MVYMSSETRRTTSITNPLTTDSQLFSIRIVVVALIIAAVVVGVDRGASTCDILDFTIIIIESAVVDEGREGAKKGKTMILTYSLRNKSPCNNSVNVLHPSTSCSYILYKGRHMDTITTVSSCDGLTD
jgi:hypothetical protein